MKADLHTHTTFSDGKFSVDELLDIAIKQGINIISITDHDCFDGVKIAITTNKNIKVITGVELSTVRNDESVHILGYFKNQDRIDELTPILDNQVTRRRKRAVLMLDKLKEHYNIILDPGFINIAESVTRGTIAREIITQGYPYTSKEIFKYMIGEGCPAYIPSTKVKTEDGIRMIKDCGGLTVIAHPMELRKNNPQEIIDLGVDGIEAKYPNRETKEDEFRKLASKNNLFITGGSDFHSFNDGRHGNIGDVVLDGDDLNRFLQVLYEC